MADKPILGLTGGIASGKSTVARMLEAQGVGIVDADRVYRDVVAPGGEALAAIVAEFGAGVLDAHGALDRERLAAIVFGDAQARAKLNAITHPRIGVRSMELLAGLQQGPHPYLVYEAPLLVEVGAHRGLAALIVVAADPSLQVERAIQRDGATAEQAQSRIAAQLPLPEKVAVADYVIYNDGSLDTLRERVRAAHEAILERFGAGT
jgi:dephospho-CoA kinase